MRKGRLDSVPSGCVDVSPVCYLAGGSYKQKGSNITVSEIMAVNVINFSNNCTCGALDYRLMYGRGFKACDLLKGYRLLHFWLILFILAFCLLSCA